MFENSYKIRVSGRAVIFHENKVLLNRFGDGAYYNFPGGGIEERENARMAAVREVREETGLEVSAGEFVFALEYEPYSAGHIYGDAHHISFFFKCELLSDSRLSTPEIPDVNPWDPAMTSQPVWLPTEQLAEIELLPHINQNLLQYQKTGVFQPAFFNEPYENRRNLL